MLIRLLTVFNVIASALAVIPSLPDTTFNVTLVANEPPLANPVPATIVVVLSAFVANIVSAVVTFNLVSNRSSTLLPAASYVTAVPVIGYIYSSLFAGFISYFTFFVIATVV